MSSTLPKADALLGAVVVLCGLAALFAIVLGVLSFFDGPEIDAREREVLAHAPLHEAGAGEKAHAQGLVAAATPRLRDEFVTYRLWRYQSTPDGRGSEFVEIGGENQPLLLETPTGAVRIPNADYAFDLWTGPGGDVQREAEAPTTTSGAVDIRGFRAGSPILVFGVAEGEGAARTLRAESLAPGTLPEYLDELHRRRDASRRMGWFFLGSAVPLALFALWLGRKVWRLPVRTVAVDTI